jgi:hypothetical protein
MWFAVSSSLVVFISPRPISVLYESVVAGYLFDHESSSSGKGLHRRVPACCPSSLLPCLPEVSIGHTELCIDYKSRLMIVQGIFGWLAFRSL